MTKVFRFLSFFLSFFLSIINHLYAEASTYSSALGVDVAFVQTSEEERIQGVVKEPNGEPAIGVTIKIKGTNLGGTTDANGRFSIKVPRAKGELEVSFVGFKTQTLAYDVKKSLSITLIETVNKLDEVNVVAYGKKTTRELVSSVATVKASDIKDAVAPSIESLLQGKMAGVQVSHNSGSPGGGGAIVAIRGINSLVGGNGNANNGSPLYVIDGVPVNASHDERTGINPLASLDPSTIESVQVLKDASSASLYGSRASNGVILITTKKGRSGRAVFNVNVSQSFSWLPETPLQVVGKAERDFFLHLAKAHRLAYNDGEKIKEIKGYRDSWDQDLDAGAYDYLWGNGKRSLYYPIPVAVQDSLNTFFNNETNWWDYYFRVGRVTKADLNASGGTDNLRYMLGGSFYDESGIMLNSSFKRANFVTNLDLRLMPQLEVFSRFHFSLIDRTAGKDRGIVQGLTVDPKSASSLLPGKGTDAERLTVDELQSTHQKNASYNIRLNAGINYQLLKDLRLTSSVAVDHHLMRSNITLPDRHNAEHIGLPKHTFSAGAMTLLQSESLLDYHFILGRDHKFDWMLGTSYTNERMESVHSEVHGGVSNSVYYAPHGLRPLRDEEGIPTSLHSTYTDYVEQRMLSFFSRLSYSYKQKYLAELAVRRDGTSVYAPRHRWGTFPSVGAGWVFTSERFMKPLWWLSFAKLRASWGRSGQKLEDAYLAQNRMEQLGSFFGTTAVTASESANTDMTWEESDQVDLGLDLYFLDQKIRVKLDYYNKYSRNLLLQVPLPGNVYQHDKAWLNSGAISNEGIELEVATDLIQKKDLSWTLSLNVARNWNLLRKAPNNRDLSDMVIGRPIFGLNVYRDEGLVQSEADIPYYYNAAGQRVPLTFKDSPSHLLGLGARKLSDLNGDGTINLQDRYYVGTTLPLMHGGFTSQLRWKNFTLDAFFSFTLGRYVINETRYTSLGFDKQLKVLQEDYRKVTFWEKPGDKSDYPAIRYADAGYVGQFDTESDRHIENVSYLRLGQLSFSYTLPKSFLSKIKVKDLRLFLSAENLFLLHNYSGLDPELVDAYSGRDRGDRYPLNRKVTLGLNFKF